MGTNTFEHAFKSEKFTLRRPAVFSQNAILSSIISRQCFHCSTTRIDDDTRLCHSKGPISINQSSFQQKTGFARIILSYVTVCVLNVNDISCLQLRESTNNAF